MEDDASWRIAEHRRATVVSMARPEKIPQTLEDAVAQLKRDPWHPVHAKVDGLEVELRVVRAEERPPGLGTRLAAIGPWEGIELEELINVLREARESGGSASPPELP
jgi:hypothetical protein